MNWHGFCFRDCALYVIRMEHLQETDSYSKPSWIGFQHCSLGHAHRAGMTPMTPAWCYETLPLTGSPVWWASDAKTLFSQTGKKEQERSIQSKLSPAGFGYRCATCILWPVWFLLYYFVNCWSHLLLSISVARIASFHPIFPYSCTKTSSSPLLHWVEVHGVVYSTTIYTTQLVLSASDEWMSLYSVWERNYGVVSRFLMNKRKSSFCVPNITTSHVKECSLPLFKNEKYGNSVRVMYF